MFKYIFLTSLEVSFDVVRAKGCSALTLGLLVANLLLVLRIFRMSWG